MQYPPPIVTREDRSGPRPSSGWLGVPVVLVLLAGAWIAMAQSAPSFMVPSPAAVLAALDALARDPALQRAAATTLLPAGLGFLIALGIGAVAAAVLSGPLRMGALALLGLPAAAFVPLGAIWFGIGNGTAMVGAAVLAFGPIVVGFAADGAARRPAAAVGAAMALNGALVAEFVAGQAGLGYLLTEAMVQLNTPKAFALMLILGAIGIVAVLAVHALFAVFVSRERGAGEPTLR